MNIRYVGFWMRFLATILDTIWLYGGIYLIFSLFVEPSVFGKEINNYGLIFTVEYLIPFFIVILFWKFFSATPAKILLNLKIVDANTFEPTTTKKLVLRYLSYFLSMLPLCYGFLSVGWNARKQGWHDIIANTVVVCTKKV